MHGDDRPFGEHGEVFVGYDRRDLDDEIRIGLQARHFQIDPNEIVGRFHGVSKDLFGMVAGGTGIVLASFGRSVLVQASEGLVRCGLKGRKLRVVCGDRVAWGYPPSADGPSVESVEPRRNLIERIDARGRAEPVAANVDRLAIVAAPQPEPDWFLVDRYWAGAALKDLDALVIVNKKDLGTGRIEPQLDEYRRLNLNCIEVSCQSREGIAELAQILSGRVNLLVGQSGVGKSSLVNALAPTAEALTAELTRDAEGRHTTTTARWYQLDASVRDRRCARRARLRAARALGARRGARLRRNSCAQRAMPVQGLPAHGGAGLRGASRRDQSANLGAPLRKLSAPVPALRETGFLHSTKRWCALRAHAPGSRHRRTPAPRPPGRRAQFAMP